MNFNKIIKIIAKREKTSKREILAQMQLALREAGLECSVKEFIKQTTKVISERLYIV